MDIINTQKRAQGRASCSLFPVGILSKLCVGLQKPGQYFILRFACIQH